MFQLRDYQQCIVNQVLASNKDDLIQLDTGGGKTPILQEIIKQKDSICVAHRNMLVEQISQTLSIGGINHQIIACKKIIKRCQVFQRKYGVKHTGSVYVGSIQSLVSWYKRGHLSLDVLNDWQVLIDEAHHVVYQNQWHKLSEIFPHARYIGATATPCRMDNIGLHKDCGGLFDELVVAKELERNSTAKLISKGYLSDYVCYSWPEDLTNQDLTQLDSKDYCFSTKQLNQNYRTLGSPQKHYKRLAHNKITLAYCPSIHAAQEEAKAFRCMGYSTSYIASTLTLAENMHRLDEFRAGRITMLFNVDMATEGFDLPEIECLMMMRKTDSFNLFKQMVGRVLRPKPNGEKAIIFDFAGNILKHGLPDDHVAWDIYGNYKSEPSDLVVCDECFCIYDAFCESCPECGTRNPLLDDDYNEDTWLNGRRGTKRIKFLDLVQKVRGHFEEKYLEEEKEKTRIAYEESLYTTVHQHKWQYGSSPVEKVCSQLATWFIENLAQTDLEIYEINQFVLGKKPDFKFWSAYFTMNDLKSNNPDKCKKVFEEWQQNKQ